jgi:phosphohistidine phosphatase SixA
MKVILLRHAARELALEIGDSGLSATGRLQAKFLTTLLPTNQETTNRLPRPTKLIASPKKRARETLQPLSIATNITPEIDNRVDERHQSETESEFKKRIASFLTELTNGSSEPRSQAPDEPAIFICSHLDWLETAILLLPTDLSELEISLSWTNAQFRIFNITDGFWKLESRCV